MTRLRKSAFGQFVTDHHIHTLLILFSAIVFVFFTSKDYIPFAARFVVPFVLLALVTVADMRVRSGLLALVVVGLGLNVWLNYYVIANHGFMITFIGLALMIACAAGKEQASVVISRAAVLLLSILMGLALIQKLVSSHYMSGDLVGSYLLQGQMFKVLISLFYSDWPAVVASNLAADNTLLMSDPPSATAALTVPPMIPVLAVGLTWAALASQAGMEICILLRHKLGIWVHYALLLFVLIIYSTRNENIFLSMNLILGYAMTTEETKSTRVFYAIGIAYLLVMEMMGLRPGIIG